MDEILALVVARRAEARYLKLSQADYTDRYPDATNRLDTILQVYTKFMKDDLRHVYEVRGIDGLLKELYK